MKKRSSKKRRRVREQEPRDEAPVYKAPLHTRYRPVTLDDVIGQASTVKALKNVLSGLSTPHSYLFTGPSGVGKTTLARIIATMRAIPANNVLEIDAATYSGIDAMRNIKDGAAVPAFGTNPKKLIIIDECHSLSKQAWQSWLKLIEEPPEHLYIAFCTTEAGKVPRTIKTRCQAFDLKPVSTKEIASLLDEVLFAEIGGGSKLGSDALRAIAAKSDGSVRQALVYLQQVMHCKSKSEALKVLDSVDTEGDAAFAIVRAIVGQASFMKIKQMIAELEEDNVEGIRIVTMNYAAKALLGSKSKDKCGWLLDILDEFSEPFDPNLKKAPLLLAVGRLLF